MRIRALTVLVTVTAAAAFASVPGIAADAASPHARSERVCGTPAAGFAACLSLRRTDLAPLAKATPNGTPSGYGPTDIQGAYNLANAISTMHGAISNGATAPTVAIVDAYNDPNAENDLGVYRSQFGLPACTTANGCFRKVNQSGGTKMPRNNGGWAQEISLDLDMVSATCPDCKILLVEASSSSFKNLGTAVQYAASQKPAAISNSYGGGDASDATYGKYYNFPGIAVTASTGDNGYQGGSYPASSSYVVAVGGTSLTKASSTRGWAETVWSGAGSGCSTYNAALAAASTFDTGCTKRAMADVSAVADPGTGVAVYDSFAYQGVSGWLVFGGTSVSSPIIASVYALSGNTGNATTPTYANALPYKNDTTTATTAGNMNDVTSGSNGTCSPTQLCTARTGWDGPTGLGTPNGTSAF